MFGVTTRDRERERRGILHPISRIVLQFFCPIFIVEQVSSDRKIQVCRDGVGGIFVDRGKFNGDDSREEDKQYLGAEGEGARRESSGTKR